MLGQAREHFGTDLLTIVESERNAGPAFALKRFVGAGLSLDSPANPKQSR